VPNKFPALQVEGTLNKRGDGIYDRMQGIGAHEVIIDAPQCVRSFTELPDAAVQEMIWMYRDRLVDLRRDQRLKYGMVFKNAGLAAGATLYHSHSQLIVTPIIPLTIQQKMEACRQFYEYRGRCLLCDLAVQEMEAKVRVVMDSGLFLALEPYAPRMPFETWVLPKNHESHFENIQQQGCEELAFILKRTVQRLEKGLGRVAYNYMLTTSPFDSGPLPHFHWHIEIVPRLTKQAGFEWGTGFYINPVPPEEAAEFLRSVTL
jgi:UDPglucose--hexose-1-phosphate uridylyltransferase